MKVALITAMPAEVWPLIRGLPPAAATAGRGCRFYQLEGAVLLCGGIGHEAGVRAAEAVVERYQPSLLLAVGLAGGLRPEWKLGRTLIAAEVIEAATGRRYRTLGGTGVVVSSPVIARRDDKHALAARFPEADVVDMEGAAVGEVAARHGLPFLAVKAVADELDFELPPLQPFVDAAGNFQAARFTAWAALRPQWWPAIARLKRRSDLAAAALCALLREIIDRYRQGAELALVSGHDFSRAGQAAKTPRL